MLGVGGSGTDAFDRPTCVAVARNGGTYVSDGHSPNKSNNGRVVKFSKDGRFIKTWGHEASAPGDLSISGLRRRRGAHVLRGQHC